MYINFLIFNLPNERDDLILETDVNNKHWTVVLNIKEGEKLCKYFSKGFNKAKYNYLTMEREILIGISGIEKFLFFLPPKHFLV